MVSYQLEYAGNHPAKPEGLQNDMIFPPGVDRVRSKEGERINLFYR